MKKMNVLMIGWEFPPLINGGLGVACLGLAEAMSKYVNLSIILPRTDPEFIVNNVELIGVNNINVDDLNMGDYISEYETFAEVDTIETTILPYVTDENVLKDKIAGKEVKEYITSKTSKAQIDAFKEGNLYGDDVINKVIEYSRIAVKIAAKKDFDVIHAHDWMTFLAGVEIKKQFNKPLVLHVHALQYDRGGPDARGWIYDLEKYAMEHADIVIPVSHYTGGICVNHYGIDPAKVKPVHNGALPVKTYHAEKSFPEAMILFLGRITEQKGPEFFLDIASEVIKHNKKVRFVMAGTGDKLKRLIETGAYKHVGDKFHFTGFLNKEKVNKLLSMTDVYCMPSVSEPFGLSALEAAQFGIPAVISKQSGVAEVLNGALKADYWDTKLMAKHIIDLISDEKLKEEVVNAGYEDLKNLSWDHSAEKINTIFHELVS